MKEIHTKTIVRIALAAVLGLVIGLTRAGEEWGSAGMNAVAMVVCTLAIGWLLDRHDGQLTARIRSTVSQVEWEVALNGIKIGTMKDGEYASMQQAAYRDRRVAGRQLMNLGRVALTMLDKLVLGIPLMAFWLAVLLALLEPGSLGDLVRELQKANPQALTDATKQFLQMGLMFTAPITGVMVLIGYRFGFRNCYVDSVRERIRQHFNMAADGSIAIYRLAFVNGALA